MKSEPWIEHFKKTVGQPTVWGTPPRPVVISAPDKKKPPGGQDSARANMPLTVVSPMEQYNEMAEAELNKPASQPSHQPLTARPRVSAPRKRKSASSQGKQPRKVLKVKDIFSRHGQ